LEHLSFSTPFFLIMEEEFENYSDYVGLNNFLQLMIAYLAFF
jgi:hypothetical protein